MLLKLPKDVQKIVWKELFCDVLKEYEMRLSQSQRKYKFSMKSLPPSVCMACGRYSSMTYCCGECSTLYHKDNNSRYTFFVDVMIYIRFIKAIYPQYRLDQSNKKLN